MKNDLILKLILCSLLVVFLSACGRSQAELDATSTRAAPEQFATETPGAPTTTIPLTDTPIATITPKPTKRQTATSIPSSTPTSQTDQTVIIEQSGYEPVTIPPCTEGETNDKTLFNELIFSLANSLSEADSYRYRTLYRYTKDDHYADNDLSLDIEGAHSDLLESPMGGIFYPLASQSYERSHVVLTDLPTMSSTETIITEDGVWVRADTAPSWMALDSATSTDMVNLADMFSPQLVLSFMIGGGGGSLAPGVRAEEPSMAQVETLNGQDVMHRCWRLPVFEDDEINAYLIHYESIYTFLNNAEIHLWTAEDDTQLVRLALVGDHVGERLGEYEGEMHDIPSGFLLYVEITELDQPIEITAPTNDMIELIITKELAPEETVSAPFNQLPLPQDAELVGVFGESESMTPVPREYSWPAYEVLYNVLGYYSGSGWYQTPEERRPIYQTELNLSDSTAFYLEEMSRLGWYLTATHLQLGWPVMYMIFEKEGAILPLILETTTPDVTRIAAILPPSEDVLEAVLSGWESYTTQNSDLGDDMISAIAIDTQGIAWIGTNSGLSSFDGESWTTYTAKDLNLSSESPEFKVSAVSMDQDDRLWVGSREGLSVFDGETWKTYTIENSELSCNPSAITVDSAGRVWLGLGYSSSVSVFDGNDFTNYGVQEIGMPAGHAIDQIAADQQDRIWIGTSGGGVYVFDGKTWKTVLKAKSPANTTYTDLAIEDLVIDHQGWVWIGTGQGLSFFDGETWTTYNTENSGLADDWVKSLAVDEYNNVWVATTGGRLNGLDANGEWTDYTPIDPNISLHFPEAMVIDPQGRIWIGSNFDGISVFTPP